MVEIKSLAFDYGSEVLFTHLDFCIRRGRMTALLGGNGAGKSTILSLLNGLLRPKAGQILLEGRDLAAHTRNERARKIAYLPQKLTASATLVADAVLLGRLPHMAHRVTERDLAICSNVMHALELVDLSDRLLTELSGGQLQKVLLARALVQEPELLLLDEPTANLDVRGQVHMLDRVQSLVKTRGLTALVVLHDVNLALRFCDEFVFLHDGRALRAEGPEAVTPQILSEVYCVHAALGMLEGRRVAVFD